MQGQIVNGQDKKANEWSMFVHFSLFAGYVIPLAGLIVPIMLWQIKKDEWPIVDQHGKNVVNWIISMIIYFVISGILCLVLVGFILIPILIVLDIVFPIIGGIKANQGEVWKYPLTIPFIK